MIISENVISTATRDCSSSGLAEERSVRVLKIKEKVRRTTPQSSRGAMKQSAEGLTKSQIKLLRKSFSSIAPQAEIAALVFYRNLFTLDPSLRRLFHTDIEVQGRKLMEALNFTVATIEDPAKLCPALEAMGRRHATYGVLDEHYETVTCALLQTLREIFCQDFNSELEIAWRGALTFVGEVMKRGAASVNALPSSVQNRA